MEWRKLDLYTVKEPFINTFKFVAYDMFPTMCYQQQQRNPNTTGQLSLLIHKEKEIHESSFLINCNFSIQYLAAILIILNTYTRGISSSANMIK